MRIKPAPKCKSMLFIGFKRAAYDHGSFDLTTQYDLLREAFKKKNSGGSNIHEAYF
ncbi:hypothetical protein [Absicoccus porci]|uniref:hypothetical protein n=1 Tax=Absicoccus porci TaxID=2486576 RepID=UPI003D8D76F8